MSGLQSIRQTIEDASNSKLNLDGGFTCFDELPVELRLKIWQAAIPGPRMIKLTSVKNRKDSHSWAINTIPRITMPRTSRIPPILHASSDARRVALPAFTVAFKNCRNAKPAYINFEIDCIYFDDMKVLADLHCLFSVPVPTVRDFHHQIQFMMIGGDAIRHSGRHFLKLFTELKSITFERRHNQDNIVFTRGNDSSVMVLAGLEQLTAEDAIWGYTMSKIPIKVDMKFLTSEEFEAIDETVR